MVLNQGIEPQSVACNATALPLDELSEIGADREFRNPDEQLGRLTLCL